MIIIYEEPSNDLMAPGPPKAPRKRLAWERHNAADGKLSYWYGQCHSGLFSHSAEDMAVSGLILGHYDVASDYAPDTPVGVFNLHLSGQQHHILATRTGVVIADRFCRTLTQVNRTFSWAGNYFRQPVYGQVFKVGFTVIAGIDSDYLHGCLPFKIDAFDAEVQQRISPAQLRPHS
jgi:hypothetical protein